MEYIFEPLWHNGPVYAQSPHFLLGTDSILLADFVRPRRSAHGLDLGCGAGILMILLKNRLPGLSIEGLELQADAADIARENLRKNFPEDPPRVRTGDLRNCRAYYPAGSFDFLVSNPPYFSSGSGRTAPEANRALARSEISCTLKDFCGACAYLLPTGGSLSLVYRAERLVELCTALCACRLEPKRIRYILNRSDSAPKLFLLEARKDAAPGLRTEPNLLCRNADGSTSAEIRRIYHLQEKEE
jgi:tRNA1Val (adenine37-N6)-methyltransferase